MGYSKIVSLSRPTPVYWLIVTKSRAYNWISFLAASSVGRITLNLERMLVYSCPAASYSKEIQPLPHCLPLMRHFLRRKNLIEVRTSAEKKKHWYNLCKKKKKLLHLCSFCSPDSCSRSPSSQVNWVPDYLNVKGPWILTVGNPFAS